MTDCRRQLEAKRMLMLEKGRKVQENLIKEIENEQEEVEYIH